MAGENEKEDGKKQPATKKRDRAIRNARKDKHKGQGR